MIRRTFFSLLSFAEATVVHDVSKSFPWNSKLLSTRVFFGWHLISSANQVVQLRYIVLANTNQTKNHSIHTAVFVTLLCFRSKFVPKSFKKLRNCRHIVTRKNCLGIYFYAWLRVMQSTKTRNVISWHFHRKSISMDFMLYTGLIHMDTLQSRKGSVKKMRLISNFF